MSNPRNDGGDSEFHEPTIEEALPNVNLEPDRALEEKARETLGPEAAEELEMDDDPQDDTDEA